MMWVWSGDPSNPDDSGLLKLLMAAQAPRGLAKPDDKTRAEFEACMERLNLRQSDLNRFAHPNMWEEIEDDASFELDEVVSRNPIPNPNPNPNPN